MFVCLLPTQQCTSSSDTVALKGHCQNNGRIWEAKLGWHAGVMDTNQSNCHSSVYKPGTVIMKFHKLCGLGRGRLVSPSNCRSEFKEEHQDVLEKGLLRPLHPHPLRAFPLSLSAPFPCLGNHTHPHAKGLILLHVLCRGPCLQIR